MRTAFTGAILAGTLAAAGVASAGPTNRGGALLLSVVPGVTYEYGTLAHCGDLRLTDAARAVVRVPGDGVVRLVGLYAVFPADSVGSVKAISFGLRYSEQVRLVGSGACSGGGLEILQNGWPASHGGTSFSLMPGAVRADRVIPLYWFALSCRGEGMFEVIPHPMPKFAGRFVNADFPPLETPIADYGRIGFDRDGHVARPGDAPSVGPTCVQDECWLLTRRECDLYGGIWLGANASCENWPCMENARLGGCCLPSGCVPRTAVECAREGGDFLGEGVECAAAPCPDDSSRSAEEAPPVEGGAAGGAEGKE